MHHLQTDEDAIEALKKAYEELWKTWENLREKVKPRKYLVKEKMISMVIMNLIDLLMYYYNSDVSYKANEKVCVFFFFFQR